MGDRRLDGLDARHPLLQSGLINSLELVGVTMALERGFGISIPATAASPENFADLEAITGLISGLREGRLPGSQDSDFAQHPLAASLLRALRRPIWLLVSFVVFLGAFDALIVYLHQGPLKPAYDAFMEQGERLYPVSGAHSQDDLAFSVSQHRIIQSRDAGAWNVAFLGDSGTHGSWVKSRFSLPAQTEKILARAGGAVAVQNLAFYIPSLPKDMMILQAIVSSAGGKFPADAVVLTMSDEYLSREHFQSSLSSYPHLALNSGLLADFGGFLGAENSAGLQSISADFRRQARKLRSPVMDWLRLHSALFHYGPYIREVLNRKIHAPLGRPKYVWATELARSGKPFADPVPATPPRRFGLRYLGLSKDDVHAETLQLTRALLTRLDRLGIPVVIYIKPVGPREWQRALEQAAMGTLSSRTLLAQACRPERCRFADARWVLSGNQFTDTLAHYSVSGNEKIAGVVADALLAVRKAGGK